MAFKIAYTFLGIDKMSGAAKKTLKALEDINRETARTNRGLYKASLRKKQAADAADDLGRKSRGAGKSSGFLGGKLKQLFVIAAGYVTLREAAQTLAAFDHSMARVKAITGATGTTFTELTNLAKDLGATTEFSASQAADGMAFLGQAGFKANEVISAMPAMLDLATGAAMGLAEAADIASNIMTPFKIGAEKAADVVDVLSYVAANSNTNVMQLGGAMKNVAPVAASLGYSMEEAAAAIGVLGDNGIQAERAGTGLKIVMQRLVKQPKEVKAAMKALGLSMQDLKGKSFAEQMQLINKRMSNVKDQTTRAKIGFYLFGSEASAVGMSLVANSDRLERFGGELDAVDGYGQKMAKTMRDTLKGDLQSLQSAVQNLFLVMGDGGLRGVLRGATQEGTKFFRALAGDPEAFMELNGFLALTVSYLRDMTKFLKWIGGLAGKLIGKFFNLIAPGAAENMKKWKEKRADIMLNEKLQKEKEFEFEKKQEPLRKYRERQEMKKRAEEKKLAEAQAKKMALTPQQEMLVTQQLSGGLLPQDTIPKSLYKNQKQFQGNLDVNFKNAPQGTTANLMTYGSGLNTGLNLGFAP